MKMDSKKLAADKREWEREMAEHQKFWKSTYKKYTKAAYSTIERMSDHNWKERVKRMKAKDNLYLKVNEM